MKIALLSLTFIVLAINVGHAKQKQGTSNETCFLAVSFVRGGMVTITLSNRGHGAHDITIQPWLFDGSPRPKLSQSVPAGTAFVVRVDVASETPAFGWFQVTQEGHSIDVSASYEYLNGDNLTTIPMLAVFRHPLSLGAVRSALKTSIHHRYTYDVFTLRGALYVFVNLSDYPVQAGMCQENYPDCMLTSLPHTVRPHASLVFPIDQERRFLVVHSTPGYSVATAVEWTEGLKQIFAANSSITFGLAK